MLTSNGCAVAAPSADWVIEFFAAGATPAEAAIAASKGASAADYMGIMTTITALARGGVLLPTLVDPAQTDSAVAERSPSAAPRVIRYTPSLPWTAMAVSGELAADLCRKSAGARRILELGPVVSTELMALMASLMNGPVELLGIEQDAAWAAATEAAVARARDQVAIQLPRRLTQRATLDGRPVADSASSPQISCRFPMPARFPSTVGTTTIF